MSAKQYFSLKLIDKKWYGTRLDKYIMQKLGLPWSAAHKLIRSKQVYVLKSDGAKVEKDIAYKLDTGDTLSIKDEALDWVDKPNDY